MFCLATGRRPRIDLDTRRYFEIADRDDLSYDDKLGAYRKLADEYFDTVRTTYPPAEQDRFQAHFRGLLGAWVTDEQRRLSPG